MWSLVTHFSIHLTKRWWMVKAGCISTWLYRPFVFHKWGTRDRDREIPPTHWIGAARMCAWSSSPAGRIGKTERTGEKRETLVVASIDLLGSHSRSGDTIGVHLADLGSSAFDLWQQSSINSTGFLIVWPERKISQLLFHAFKMN